MDRRPWGALILVAALFLFLVIELLAKQGAVLGHFDFVVGAADAGVGFIEKLVVLGFLVDVGDGSAFGFALDRRLHGGRDLIHGYADFIVFGFVMLVLGASGQAERRGCD